MLREVPQPPLHVLFVARWYPSHDQPGRGTFVADLVTALRSTGRVEVTVASFEPTHVRGIAQTRPARAAAGARTLASHVADARALNAPRSWGVAYVPVARLPAFLDGDRRRPADIVAAHADPLLAFAEGLADRHSIDVIHAHTGLPDGLAALRVADALDVPLLVTEHASTTADELADPDARDLYRRLIAPPRRVVAVSHALARDVARALGVAESAIAVLPNAVPVDGFPPAPAADRDPVELLYVGSRKASKGVETLLRAFAALQARRPDLRLRLIGSPGSGADAERWDALIPELGLSGAVMLEGPASRAAVAAAMRRAAVFVHPSPHETFGMVAAEALASGLPLAAMPSGGVDEIVGHDGRFGAVATDITVPALVDAIERALALAPRADRGAMRAHIESNYAAPAVARRTLEAYDAAIVATRSRPRPAAPWAGADRPARAPFTYPVILALARGQAIDRVGGLPLALRDRLTVITSPRGRYADDRDLPLWADWLELDQESFYRSALAELDRAAEASRTGLGRVRSMLGGPNVERMRRELDARRDEVRQQGVAGFVRAAAARVPRLPGAGDSPPWIVALDADDLILAAELGESVGRVAPGGLRWLADAWDAAGRP
jgi:glycosyltransferase involved in cell wall biosynthesis